MSRRERFKTWLVRPGRGLEIGEVWNIAASGFYAWRSVDVFDGRPVAPLTSQTILGANNGVWYWALIANAVIVLLALIVGLATNNTYRIRSYVSLASSLLWIVVTTVAFYANLPLSLSSSFLLTCIVSWVMAVLLAARADKAHPKTPPVISPAPLPQ